MAVDRSTIWPYRGGEPGEFYYQRYAHPTGVEAERALGELDGGHALLFPSGAGGEQERVSAVELPECALGLDSGRVRIALVVELAGLAAPVGPDRRAVDGHAATLTPA